MTPLGIKPRVCAVSYLNTSPLVWGFEHTPLGEQVSLEYALPSVCADRVREGSADIGIVPVIEIERQGLEFLPDVGIACDGAVRSILLVSRQPLDRIRTLAADTGSRTSVMLARVILAERFGAEPETHAQRADLESMLAGSDAALIIGDPALRLDPVALKTRYEVLDLGEEWLALTGLPMVFALWAGRAGRLPAGMSGIFAESCRYGLDHIPDIVRHECLKRDIPETLGEQYLTRHIVFQLGERHREGMRRYLRMAASLEKDAKEVGTVSA